MAPLVATRLENAIAHRTWTLPGAGRGTLFLLAAGRAVLSRDGAVAADIGAPCLLWLPPSVRGKMLVMAGTDGFAASVDEDFIQRIAAGLAVAAPLRPLLERFVLGMADAATLPPLSASFAALVAESRDMRPGAAAMQALHLGLVLVQLWRTAGLPNFARAQGGASTVQRFRQLVELHYREGLAVGAFAERLRVSRAHLHDACVRATGLTPLALLHERLLTEARARLEQTDLAVEQVGYGIGFRDPAYFSRFFKRATGSAPGAYRRAALAAAAARVPPASFAAWP